MTTATARFEFRVTPDGKTRIERAAELIGEPPTAFARTAAEERAERVLREHEATTTVPSAFFDDLLVVLDASAEPNAPLTAAFARLATTVTRG